MVGLPRTNGPESLAAAYAGADVYVNASHCETFPLTNLEALASGTPVVTYDVGGSSEAVDARCGRVVSVGDVDGLAQAVLAAQELSPADCLSRAAQFPMSRMISQYLGLYDRCVGRDGK